MNRHIERALARARLSSGRGHAAANLENVARKVADTLSRMPAPRTSTSTSRCLRTRIPMEQGDLTELLGNLMDNGRNGRPRAFGCASRRVPSPSRTTVPACRMPNWSESANAAGGWTRPSRAPAWAFPSSRTLPTLYGLQLAYGAPNSVDEGQHPPLTCFSRRILL